MIQMDPELSMVEDNEEVQIIGGNERESVVMQSIKSIEDAWNDDQVKHEVTEEETVPVEVIEQPEPLAQGQTHYVTRSGRVSRPPNRLIEMAYAVVKDTYIKNFQDTGSNDSKTIIECTYAMKALLLQKALRLKPDEAMKALREEVEKTVKIDIWEPVHLESLSAKNEV